MLIVQNQSVLRPSSTSQSSLPPESCSPPTNNVRVIGVVYTKARRRRRDRVIDHRSPPFAAATISHSADERRRRDPVIGIIYTLHHSPPVSYSTLDNVLFVMF